MISSLEVSDACPGSLSVLDELGPGVGCGFLFYDPVLVMRGHGHTLNEMGRGDSRKKWFDFVECRERVGGSGGLERGRHEEH